MKPETQERINQLHSQTLNIRRLQQSAANMRNATQYGRLERELETLYREIDKLQKDDK